MKKYLRCFKDGLGITAGKVYEVIREERGYFVFIDDDKHEHLWSQGSVRGESYIDHFTLETEDDNAPITVLPDESLGGVLREYREVKRKASEGDLIKVVGLKNGSCGGRYYQIGNVAKVQCTYSNHGNVVANFEGNDYVYDSGKWSVGYEDYVVLEPSDILVIDGTRYRMVDRKAAVGERVIITNAEPGYGYEQGGVYEIMTLDCDDPCIWPDGTDQSEIYVESQEYRVLEPVETAATPQLSELPASDQIAENIASLAARVSGLEAKVAEMMRPVNERVNPAELSMSKSEVEAAIEVFSQPIPPQKTAQQIRDEIVERAKADVKDLRKFKGTPIPNAHNGVHFWPETPELKDYIPMHTVEYVVNREKRRVTAIIHNKIRGRVNAVGRATCVLNDVFSVHIGKAIALRRALGLEVPSEYLSVPNPEEVAV